MWNKWKFISKSLTGQLSTEVLSKIEGLVALFLALSEVQTEKGFLSVLLLYVKTHCDESVIKFATDQVSKLFMGYTAQSSSRPRWLEEMKNLLVDWKLLINSPSFSKISRVLTLLVTIGAIDAKKVCLGNFEIFAVEAEKKQINAMDFVDAIVETIVFFAEGAYQCFLKGSVKPLLFSSSEVVQLEEACIEKMAEWEFVRNGNLTKFSQKTEAQFDKELTELIENLHNLYKTMPPGAEKKIVQQKWEKLSLVRNEYISTRVCGGLRKSPYCVKIYGDSGVGKSTFSDLTMAVVLKAMNLPCTSDYVITLNETDKYMSNMRSHVTGIKMDDYGNTKSDFWETSPSQWIITICNNIRSYAVMADIANKGKVSIEPGCLVITTNVEDLHAAKCSYNSMSIIRRAHLHVQLDVLDEFKTNNMLDSTKVMDKFGSLDQINDIWKITIRTPIPQENDDQMFQSFVNKHAPMNIYEYLDFLAAETRKHEKIQESIVTSFKEPSTMVHLCQECGNLAQNCLCDLDSESEGSTETKMSPQFGERLAYRMKQHMPSKMDCMLKKLEIENSLEDMAIDLLMDKTKELLDSPYVKWESWIPTEYMEHRWVQKTILWYGKDWMEKELIKYRNNYICSILLYVFLIYYYTTFPIAFLFGICCCCYYSVCYAAVKVAKTNAYLDEVTRRRGTLHEAFISARDNHVKYACGMFAGLAVLYGAVQLYRALKDTFNIQGKLNPKCVADIQERDAESSPWAKTVWTPPSSEKIFGQTDEAHNFLKKNMGEICIGSSFSGAVMLETHVLLVPGHIIPSSIGKCSVMLNGNKLRFILNPETVYHIPNKDLALVYVPNCAPSKKIYQFVTDEDLKMAMSCTMFGLNKERNDWFSSKLLWQYSAAISNGHCAMSGSYYDLTMPTFDGMCMSPIVTNANVKIVGFHIGGITNTVKGCGVAVTRECLEIATCKLLAMNKSFVRGAEVSPVPDTICNKNIAISEEVRKHCPSRFITGDCDIEVFGSVTGQSSYRSDVITTPISEAVEEVCGVPNQWGPPKFTTDVVNSKGETVKARWQPWFASLEVCSKPSIGFDPVEVERAMDDYMLDLKDKFEEQKELWVKDMRPLTNVEIVSGIDGKRFIDSMPSGTSMGYPIGGPKNRFLEELTPTEDNMCPKTFTSEIWELFDDLLEKADRGETLNQIFGASLKDEPTKMSKDKVRVFQAAPITLQIGIRKYFLPVARFLSTNPLVSECAVGINSHGPEWDELSRHMAKFGDDRIIAGDYSKYDLRMPAQLTLAAFEIMIEIAKWSGNYTPRDINRMRILAHEVCTPLVAYDGTLMRFIGTNPSGQNMTVYVNSIDNSLFHRLAFFFYYSEQELAEIGQALKLNRPARFRDLVALSTYGDDAKGSVRPGYDKFNHVSMANYLRDNDMVFTMPDKESDPVAFMHRNDADFLKRKDRYDEDLGVYVGMLDEMSIFKSLHSILKSKVVTPEDVSGFNIESGLREWFYHGREVYEFRRSQMKEVVEKTGVFVRDLDKTFDDRVKDWKDKYVPQSGQIESDIDEDALQDEVVAKLGTPTRREYDFICPNLGKGDLLYCAPSFNLIIETKKINGKPSRMEKAKSQALKYAMAVAALQPTHTVIGMVYTEYGFQLVRHFGPFDCPAKFVSILTYADFNV